MRNDALGIPLLISLAIHVSVIMVGALALHNNHLRRKVFLPIDLVDLPRPEIPPPQRRTETPPETMKKPAPPPPKAQKSVENPPIANPPIAKPEAPAPLAPAPIKEEPAKAIEAKTATPAQADAASSARVEGGGSEAGAGNLFGKGDIGVAPGTGISGGGGGTAASGLGRGSGAPGLPAIPLRTNRDAKPLQTVRANYPPMALRAGLESDVTLKIEVDPQGRVKNAEIIKSGGGAFDEEALRAVRQARFEPAQKDGQNVPAEFTYVYRFRLQK